MLDASYTFRFGGLTMSNGQTPGWLVGLGHITFTPDGRVTGEHSSSATLLSGDNAQQLSTDYSLSGTYTLGDNLTGDATIAFVKKWPRGVTPNRSADLNAKFKLVGVGDYDRLWLISTWGEIPAFGLSADEVVSGEAVRIR